MRPIDADKLKRKVQRIATEAWMMKLNASVETTLNQFLDYIDQAPTIEPKRGEWIYCEDYVGHDGYECSNCGFFVPWAYDCYADSNFILNYHICPHCGARMKGE